MYFFQEECGRDHNFKFNLYKTSYFIFSFCLFFLIAATLFNIMFKVAAMGFGLLYIKRNLRCLYTAELTPLVRIEGSRGARMHAS